MAAIGEGSGLSVDGPPHNTPVCIRNDQIGAGRVDALIDHRPVIGDLVDDLTGGHVHHLAAILGQAVDDGLIGRNPARRTELPRATEPERRYLTAKQVTRLTEAMPTRQHATMVYVLAYGGLRWGELVALRRGRVDSLRRTLQIAQSATEVAGYLEFGTTRTHQSRIVHLPAFVSELLGRHLEDIEDKPEAFVFPAPRGGPLRYPNMRKAVWDRARDQAEGDLADITPHDLRHTCASLMRATGADVKAIQQQLGHRNATITLNTYTHLFEGDLAAVMDRLDTKTASKTRPERVLREVVDLPQQAQNPR